MTHQFSIAVVTALLVASASGCSAQSARSSTPEIDVARRTVSAGFARPASAYFKDEKVVTISGTQGSRATVVCGEVNRQGRDQSITGGWRPFYYVVSYAPVATYNGTVVFDEAAEKRVSPPLYHSGDYDVLFGDDDATIGINPTASTFATHWVKFCTGRTDPIDEWTLQERGRPTS